MPTGYYFIGVLCFTFFLSRIVGLAVDRFLPHLRSKARLAATHTISAFLISAMLLAIRSPDLTVLLVYILVQALWWLIDWARLFKPSSRSRLKNPFNTRMTTVTLGVVMAIATTGYAAHSFVVFQYDSAFLGTVPTGVSHSEVLYSAGHPAKTRDGPDASWSTVVDPTKGREWRYKAPSLYVHFDPVSEQSSLVTCSFTSQETGVSCPASFLARVGSSDIQVVDRLGAPSMIVEGVGRKLFRYPEIGKDFLLEQYSVREIRSYPDNNNYGAKLWRLVRFSIP